MIKKTHWALLLLALTFHSGLCAKNNRKADRELIDRVANWQIAHFAEVKHKQTDWTNGALYRGMLEWAGYTGTEAYYDFLLDIGRKNSWGFLPRVYHADDLCVAQTYIGLYRKYGEEAMIAQVKQRVDQIVDQPSQVPLWHGVKGGSDRWSWCDALFMAPPVFVELYGVTKDRKYLDFMDREYKLTTDSLYSPDDGLYYRDRNFKNRKEKNGAKVFWGRGNGWVFGGLALMLEHLPADEPSYAYYLQIYRQMADAIIKCQDSNGSWRASMYDPGSYPLAENSGSAFFVYGLAWGVNHKILKEKKYKQAALKGWTALKGYVEPDGKLTCVQPVGAAPGKYTPDKTEVYGVGAFLLAGKEMQQMR